MIKEGAIMYLNWLDVGAFGPVRVVGFGQALWGCYLVEHTDDGTRRYVPRHCLSDVTSVGAGAP